MLAVAGLAQPQAFFDMLTARGLQVQPLPLPDHAPFTPLPWPTDTADVVLTEKDAVKLPLGGRGALGADLGAPLGGTTHVWVATLDFLPDPGLDQALRRLCSFLQPRPPKTPP